MNVFEDLIEELKEENLLEETVIETQRQKEVQKSVSNESVLTSGKISSESKVIENAEVTGLSAESESDLIPEVTTPQLQVDLPVGELTEDQQLTSDKAEVTESANIFAEPFVSQKGFNDPTEINANSLNGKEYFRKRAIDEVTGLQMVDHVLSGVERGQMKIVPKAFDDIPVKKALHDFMQIIGNPEMPDHARAEFQLMQETESWYSALSHRDKHISVAHLRRFCETTKPALSPQALISLGRFYRNSPYSEQVRSKFDLVLTRLLSTEDDTDHRELLFDRDELIIQVKELYADWSSIQIYSANEEDSDILISILKFEDFIKESENTKSFDDLIKNDFFNRLRMFKENCHENFFSPLITAAAIEANIRIGNRYVDLIQNEKEKNNIVNIEEKYGFLHDQAISDATSKSFQLIEQLKERTLGNDTPAEIVEVHATEQAQTARKTPRRTTSRLYGTSKWLIGLTVLTILACVAVYFWAEQESKKVKIESSKVIPVNLENSSLKDYLNDAKINSETFYGFTNQTWDSMTRDKKEALLKQIFTIGIEKGFKKVQLVNEKGLSVGFASAERVEVYNH